MKRDRITVVHFSPTGGTRKAALNLAVYLGETVKEIALDKMEGDVFPEALRFQEDETVLVAVPVFGGRIPAYAAEKLKLLTGKGTPAITAAVYGNRAYEDALLELNDLLRAQGFKVAASAALLAEHSMVREVAAGRPDEKDESQMKEYAKSIQKKLDSGVWEEAQVPGDRPYRDWKKMPVAPCASEACSGCGLCAEKCPVGAIPKDALKTADTNSCILCMRCVAVCPSQARSLPKQAAAMLEQKLMPLKDIRKDNELFI